MLAASAWSYRRCWIMLALAITSAQFPERIKAGDIPHGRAPASSPVTATDEAAHPDSNSIAGLIIEREKLLREMNKASIPQEATNDWASTATTQQTDLYFSYHAINRRLRNRLVEEWIATGNPAGIPAIPLKELAEKAPSVLRSFQKVWSGPRVAESEAKSWLREDIVALKGEYSAIAFQALYSLIASDGELHVDHPGRPFVYSERRQRELHEAFEKWYEQEKDNLRWNPELGQFTTSKGKAFRLPS